MSPVAQAGTFASKSEGCCYRSHFGMMPWLQMLPFVKLRTSLLSEMGAPTPLSGCRDILLLPWATFTHGRIAVYFTAVTSNQLAVEHCETHCGCEVCLSPEKSLPLFLLIMLHKVYCLLFLLKNSNRWYSFVPRLLNEISFWHPGSS